VRGNIKDMNGRVWVVGLVVVLVFAQGVEAVKTLENVTVTKISDLGRKPSWSPDGRRIIFSTYSDPCRVWTVNADGGDPTLLMSISQQYELPTSSPDGTKIAFTRYEGINKSSLWIIDVSTNNSRRLADSVELISDSSWSPDGSKIAFTGMHEIFVVNTDGSNLVKLTDDGGSPSWSPDGSRIAFTSKGIHVMFANGTYEKRLTSGPDGNPSWSPDGSRIAFDSIWYIYSRYEQKRYPVAHTTQVP
jgi:Tol biopolymer transport system component